MAWEPRSGGNGELGPSLECGALWFVHTPAPFLPVPLPGHSSLFSFGKSLPHSMPACGLGGLPHQNPCELQGWARGWAWDPSRSVGPLRETPAATPEKESRLPRLKQEAARVGPGRECSRQEEERGLEAGAGRSVRRGELGLQKQKSIRGDPEHQKRGTEGTGDMQGQWDCRKQREDQRDAREKSRSEMMRVWL